MDNDNGIFEVTTLPSPSSTASQILVCDVGGSHISAAVCRNRELELGPVVSAAYASAQSPAAFVELIHALAVRATEGAAHEVPSAIAGLSLAFPGPFDYEQGISRMKHKLAYLNGVDLRGMLADEFACAPRSVQFLNDAAAFLLGESGAGAAKGADKLLCLTFGTGLGAAFAIQGKQVSEGHGIPDGGELWSHPYEGGILEDRLSTRAIRGTYAKLTGRDAEVSELAHNAERDPAARAAFEEFGRNLGNALRTELAEFAPATVVMGGNISRSAHLFLPAAKHALGNAPFDLKVSALFDRAALYGAALHWYGGGHGVGGARAGSGGTQL